jgi:hypothetical protein
MLDFAFVDGSLLDDSWHQVLRVSSLGKDTKIRENKPFYTRREA